MNDHTIDGQDAELLLARHGDSLYRIALGMTAQHADAEDAVQETMIRYLRVRPKFRDGEHEKAWLITVTMNICRDMLRRREKRGTVPLDAIAEPCREDTCRDALSLLADLPPKLRQVMILHYIEGYSVKETAKILGIGESAAKMRLLSGRRQLRLAYEGGIYDE